MWKPVSVTFLMWMFVTITSMISLQSCDITDNCGPFREVELTELNNEVRHIRAINSRSSYDFSIFIPERDYPYRDIGIILELSPELISSKLLGLGSAYACSPPESYAEVSDIEIISNGDYNEEYVSGTNIVDLFNIRSGNALAGFVPSDYLIRRDSLLFGFDQYLLNIISPPNMSGYHQFTIQFVLSNGEILTTTTEEILITP